MIFILQQVVADFNKQIEELNDSLAAKQCLIDNGEREKSLMRDQLNDIQRICDDKDAELVRQVINY